MEPAVVELGPQAEPRTAARAGWWPGAAQAGVPGAPAVAQAPESRMEKASAESKAEVERESRDSMAEALPSAEAHRRKPPPAGESPRVAEAVRREAEWAGEEAAGVRPEPGPRSWAGKG